MQTYHPPVSRLLDYAPCEGVGPDKWPDYVSEFGFTTDHIPDLLRLMQDDLLLTLDLEAEDIDLGEARDPKIAIYAPFHAWRALGQLKAVELLEVVGPFINTYELDWVWEEIPDVIALIGPEGLAPLKTAIAAEASEDKAASTLIDGLMKLAARFPDQRDLWISTVTELLQSYKQNHAVSNAGLILILLGLKATEAVELIEAAFQAKRVDEFFVGTWAQAQIELGLKTEADFTEAELTPKEPPFVAQLRANLDHIERMRKPTAFAAGLPVDPSKLLDNTPPAFSDMVHLPAEPATKQPQKGFGATQKASKKGKKKKK